MNFKQKTKELVSSKAFKNLEKYVDLIETKNKVMNLTGFKEDRLWQEGIYESIILLKTGLNKECTNQKILDIGAGVGFPSIPFIIAFPENELTIYESQKKKCSFLEDVKKLINLNIEIKNIRAENSLDELTFDLITARAVASFKILAEISHKLAKMDGKFIFIKGPKAEEEIKTAKLIIHQLKIEPKQIIVKIEEKEHHLIIYKKLFQTPSRFPREWRDIVK